jgi:hypothetical protein
MREINESIRHKTRVQRALDIVFAELGLESTHSSDVPINENSTGMPVEIAEIHGRIVTIALACWGNQEMAKRAIDRAFEIWAEESEPVSLSSAVTQILSPKVSNALIRYGIRTVGEICLFSRNSLATIGGIEQNTALNIERELEKHGFKLRDSVFD